MKQIPRREALHLIAGAFAASACSASTGQGMFLSLNGQLTSNRVPWPDFAELAAKVGFGGVDVMTEPAMKAGASQTKKLLAQLKIRPAIINFPGDFRKDDKAFRDSIPAIEQTAEFASAVDCPRMMTYILSSSNTPKDELRRAYKDRFTESARILARYHVRLGLEFLGPLHIRREHKYEFIWRMPEMLEFAKECGANVGLTLDAWHWHHAGATTADILAAGRDRIVEVHFDDAPDLPPEQIRDNARLMPGDGIIDLPGFLRALQQIGYRDALSVEVFDEKLKQGTPEQGARLGLEKSQAVFRKAGIPLS